MAKSYETRLRTANLIAVLGATAAGLAGGRLARLGEPGENFWLVFPLLLLAGALALAAVVPWWRRVDDVQKAVHLSSWYWGGTAGGIAVLMGLVAATGIESELAQGAGVMFLGQAAGTVAVYGVARWRQRGFEA
jgi:hypothetical protein